MKRDKRKRLENQRKWLRDIYHILCRATDDYECGRSCLPERPRRELTEKEQHERRELTISIVHADLALQHLNLMLGHDRHS